MDQVELGRRILEARRARGLSQAQLAQELSVDRTTLIRIEKGERRVTALELMDFSRELGRRVEWFLSQPAPAVVQHRGADPSEFTMVQPIDIELESLSADTALLRDLGRLDVNERPKVFERPGSSSDAEALGLAIRDLAGAGQAALPELVDAGQRLGLLSFSMDFGQGSADAASMVLGGHGTAVVNSSLGVGRRRLALAHELAHFMVDDQYQTDFRVDAEAQEDQHEKYIDRVARAILLPPEALRQGWEDASEFGTRGAAVRVASEYRVDMTTLARRLRELGFVDDDEAGVIRQVHTRKSDIVSLGLVVPHDLEATSLSPAFTQAVVHAYEAEDITVERAIGFMRGLFTADDFTPRSELSPDSLWGVVT